MGEAAGLPGSQTLQLRVPGRTQVSARGKKKNEDTSVKMRALQSSAKGGMHLQPSDSAGPSARTHLLTDLRQQQHPERSTTSGLHGPGARGLTGLSSAV
jgi:hypothetical protein